MTIEETRLQIEQAKSQFKPRNITTAQRLQQSKGLSGLRQRQSIEAQKSEALKQISQQEAQFESEVAKYSPEQSSPQYKEQAYQEAKANLQKEYDKYNSQVENVDKTIQRLQEGGTTNDEARQIESLNNEKNRLSALRNPYGSALNASKEEAIKGYYSGEVQAQSEYQGGLESSRQSATEQRREFAKQQGYNNYGEYEKALSQYNKDLAKYNADVKEYQRIQSVAPIEVYKNVLTGEAKSMREPPKNDIFYKKAYATPQGKVFEKPEDINRYLEENRIPTAPATPKTFNDVVQGDYYSYQANKEIALAERAAIPKTPIAKFSYKLQQGVNRVAQSLSKYTPKTRLGDVTRYNTNNLPSEVVGAIEYNKANLRQATKGKTMFGGEYKQYNNEVNYISKEDTANLITNVGVYSLPVVGVTKMGIEWLGALETTSTSAGEKFASGKSFKESWGEAITENKANLITSSIPIVAIGGLVAGVKASNILKGEKYGLTGSEYSKLSKLQKEGSVSSEYFGLRARRVTATPEIESLFQKEFPKPEPIVKIREDIFSANNLKEVTERQLSRRQRAAQLGLKDIEEPMTKQIKYEKTSGKGFRMKPLTVGVFTREAGMERQLAEKLSATEENLTRLSKSRVEVPRKTILFGIDENRNLVPKEEVKLYKEFGKSPAQEAVAQTKSITVNGKTIEVGFKYPISIKTGRTLKPELVIIKNQGGKLSTIDTYKKVRGGWRFKDEVIAEVGKTKATPLTPKSIFREYKVKYTQSGRQSQFIRFRDMQQEFMLINKPKRGSVLIGRDVTKEIITKKPTQFEITLKGSESDKVVGYATTMKKPFIRKGVTSQLPTATPKPITQDWLPAPKESPSRSFELKQEVVKPFVPQVTKQISSQLPEIVSARTYPRLTTRTPSIIETTLEPKVITETKTAQLLKVSQLQVEKKVSQEKEIEQIKQIEQLKNINIMRPKEITRIREELKPLEKTRTIQRERLFELVKQKQIQKPQLRQRQTPQRPSIPNIPRPRIPKPITKLDLGGVIRKAKSNVKQRQAYEVLTYKGGKEISLAKGLPIGKASKLGAETILSTLRASFKLKPSGFTTQEDIGYEIPKSSFGLSKRFKDVYVERKNIRLGRSGTAKEARKLRGKKLKWF